MCSEVKECGAIIRFRAKSDIYRARHGPLKKTAIPSSNTSCDSGCTMLHLRIFHGSGARLLCLPFILPPALTWTIREYTSRASGPETRITPIPPLPGGVDSAYIVLFSVGDGTTFVVKRLICHSFRMAALREDSIIAKDGRRRNRGDGRSKRGNRSFSSL